MSSPTASTEDFAKLYGSLPPVYQPHDFAERGARTKWRTTIQQALPALYLPAGLELREGKHYQPPRFDFGWKPTAEEISSICERLGLSATDFAGSDPARMATQTLLNQRLVAAHPDAQLPSLRIDTILVGEEKPSICITLADNHRTGNARPSSEAIETMRQFLGLDESREPGWYLDSTWNHWQWKNSEEIRYAAERC